MSEILSIHNLEVNFSGFKAIDGVDMSIEEGELRVIIGPNGAGKTTLMDLITGKTRLTSGKIQFEGNTISGKSVHEIASRYKIGRKFQGPNVFDNMTVRENIEVAMKGNISLFATLFYHKSKTRESRMNEIIQDINLDSKQNIPACYLSHGERQWLEIGMVIAQSPKLIILDEPTAGMTISETYKTGEMIKVLHGRHTILVVEHDMDFVKQVAGKVTVLHLGKVFAEGTFEEISSDEKVIQIYLKDDEIS